MLNESIVDLTQRSSEIVTALFLSTGIAVAITIQVLLNCNELCVLGQCGGAGQKKIPCEVDAFRNMLEQYPEGCPFTDSFSLQT